MKSPVATGEWREFDTVASTQEIAADFLKQGENVGAVLARHQTHGHGRFGREWISGRDDSLTMSLIFRDYPDHPKPYLIGMSVAVAAAGAIHAVLQWPNDLVLGHHKAGGILTELMPDQDGRLIPVVGVGINLNQKSFPEEIRERATSVHLYHGGTYEPEAVAQSIIQRLGPLPEPSSWAELSPIWHLFDHTPGKKYTLQDGREATALGIGPEGQLICSAAGETTSVLAADAIFGAGPARQNLRSS